MYLGDYSQFQHTNSEMWFFTHSDYSQWIEIGLRNGFDSSDPCFCVAYEAFWADIDQYGNEYRHTIANVIPDGSLHNYEVKRAANPIYWTLYEDYSYVGVSTVQTSSLGYHHQVGGEIELASPIDPSTHADTFDMYVQDMNTSGNWYYW
jgi:hypothetical protein